MSLIMYEVTVIIVLRAMSFIVFWLPWMLSNCLQMRFYVIEGSNILYIIHY